MGRPTSSHSNDNWVVCRLRLADSGFFTWKVKGEQNVMVVHRERVLFLRNETGNIVLSSFQENDEECHSQLREKKRKIIWE